MKAKNLGPVYVFLAAFLWSFAGVVTKYIPWNAMTIAAMRGAIAAVTIALVRRRWRVKLNFPTVASGICMAATTVLFMYANKMTTAANAIVLQYTAPIYIVLLSILLYRKKPKVLEIGTVLVTIGGIALFFFDSMSPGSLTGDLIALLAGLTFGGVFFFNGYPGAEPQDASFLGCILSALFLPAVFFDKGFTSGAGGAAAWGLILFLGVVQLGLAYNFLGKGMKTTSAVTSSIICAVEPILNPIWVFLALGERPGALSIAGAAVVIVTIVVYNVLTARAAEPFEKGFNKD